MKSLFSLIICLLCIEIYSQEKKETIIETDVKEATVFINGAQVVRKKTIELNNGKSILRFVNLSPYLDSKSVQLKANDDVMILSVNHRFNYTDSVTRSKELSDLIIQSKALEEKIRTENKNLEVIGEELLFFKDNRFIGGKNQEVSLNNFKETSNFYMEKVSANKTKEFEVKKKIEDYNKEKTTIEKQIRQISTLRPTPVSELIVLVDAKLPTKFELELSYFVNNAGWFPSYDIRAKSIDQPIELVYKANIHQSTKEEWHNIKLKLSSSDPKLGGVGPQLQPYFLNYNLIPPRYSNISNQVSGRVYDATTKEPLPGATVVIRGTTLGTITDPDGKYSLSTSGNNNELVVSFIGFESQTLPINNPVINVTLLPSVLNLDEVVVVGYGTQNESMSSALQGRMAGVSVASGTSVKKKSSMPLTVVQTENQTSFEFEIKTPYTISSDNKDITVDVEHYTLDADFEYYCTPKVVKDAFLTANIVNWEKYNLLEGEANIFFENTFVGKSVLDVRFISDTLNISMGRDKNVIVKRDKIKDFTTKQFFGNKKEETRAWQISVKNNKGLPVKMIIFDQIPVSTNEEIEVTIENISSGIFNKESGEIKWNFNLEPSGKKDIELKYKVKYPKDRNLNIE
ncbi:MAG: mucoidy inhibitor MuiA family protein [Bacteroidia bacterium]|nr:mucoidy inhibitor MuiA family protein [Bacteroidia bacterium]